MARIGIEGKDVYLGMYDSPVLAALAYDKAARDMIGLNAPTNFNWDARDHVDSWISQLMELGEEA